MSPDTEGAASAVPTVSLPTMTVCVVTYERPAFLRRCLTSLESSPGVRQVLVVDASEDDDRAVVSESTLPLEYVHAPHLAGWMTKSRNEGLRWATSEIIAFVDDDVMVTPQWAPAVRRHFTDPELTAACGRTRNGIPGEEQYDGSVGRVLPDGTLSEGFAACLDEPVPIDHGIGANMSFRRAVLERLGGFRDDYPGTALREDTDMFLRVGAAGGTMRFLPDAVVDHLPAPHVVGERFDVRYKLYARRNHLVLLARNFGISDVRVRRWLRAQASGVLRAGGPRRIAERAASTIVGCAWGAAAAARCARWRPLNPVRTPRPDDRHVSGVEPPTRGSRSAS